MWIFSTAWQFLPSRVALVGYATYIHITDQSHSSLHGAYVHVYIFPLHSYYDLTQIIHNKYEGDRDDNGIIGNYFFLEQEISSAPSLSTCSFSDE